MEEAEAAPRRGRRALDRAGGVAAGSALGGLLALVFAVQVLGYKVLTVNSPSMEPALRPGDLIVTRPTFPEQVERGEIVLFEDPSSGLPLPVVHRVVGFYTVRLQVKDPATGSVTTRESKLLRTKGDANERLDGEPVDAQRLRGRLWLVVPGAGLLLARVPIQLALFGVSGLAGAAWLTHEVRRLRSRGRSTAPSRPA